jgi:micrococcal nuclease
MEVVSMAQCRRIILPILAVFILALALLSPSYAQEYQVDRVINGDTLKVEGDQGKFTVRLVGIDAPTISDRENEAGQPFHKSATNHLAGLVQHKTVYIKFYGSDEAGRMLGEVFVRDRNVNIEMVKDGLAEVYRGESVPGLDLERYWQAEQEAIAAKRGMWVLGDKYVSPREWRRTHGN